MQKWGKSVTIVFCVSHILRFKKFLIENDTGFKINREKAKIRSSRKTTGYTVLSYCRYAGLLAVTC